MIISFVFAIVRDSAAQPPPNVHLSVMYITVRERKCGCLHVCEGGNERARAQWR